MRLHLGLVALAYDPGLWVAEAGGVRCKVQDQLGLHSKFKAYIVRTYLEKVGRFKMETFFHLLICVHSCTPMAR